MRLSREKMVALSHIVVETLEKKGTVRFIKDPNDVRLAIFNVITKFMKLEEKIDEEVRKKIHSVKKEIPEGSREWEIQFRKLYEEEWEKLRKVKS